ncbi:MAG TPA: hypothetical protein PKA20_07640 [Burkholderiaceae bacterium]|nr:hypothetical protein [Burkholderiaceae bacterium]
MSAVLTLALTTIATPAPAADGPRLGRLFLTPEQRDEIDARRRASPEPGPAATPAPAPPRGEPRPAERVVSRVDGVVRRSGGPAVVWLDEVPHQVQIGQSVEDVPGARLEGDTVMLRDPSGQVRRLRAGQSVDPQ